MAVKTYLQTALTSVQAAISDMQAQENGLHQQAQSTKQQLTQEVSKLEQERSFIMVQRDKMDDSSERHAIQARIEQANKSIDGKKAQMGQIDNETSRAQQRRTQLHRDLYNVQVEINRLMSLPDIG